VIVDAHFHVWRLARGDYGWLSPALGAIHRDISVSDWWRVAAPCGVQRGVLVQAAPTEAETQFLLATADTDERVAGVVALGDLLAPGAPDRVAALARHPKLKGLRPMLHDLDDVDWVLLPTLAPAFEAMIEHGLVFDALVRPLHLPRIREARNAAIPRLVIVLDHAGKPAIATSGWNAWAAELERVGAETSALCKLSGLLTEATPPHKRRRPRCSLGCIRYSSPSVPSACSGQRLASAGARRPLCGLVAALGRAGARPDRRATPGRIRRQRCAQLSPLIAEAIDIVEFMIRRRPANTGPLRSSNPILALASSGTRYVLHRPVNMSSARDSISHEHAIGGAAANRRVSATRTRTRSRCPRSAGARHRPGMVKKKEDPHPQGRRRGQTATLHHAVPQSRTWDGAMRIVSERVYAR
jgi:L-fuconolactonase